MKVLAYGEIKLIWLAEENSFILLAFTSVWKVSTNKIAKKFYGVFFIGPLIWDVFML